MEEQPNNVYNIFQGRLFNYLYRWDAKPIQWQEVTNDWLGKPPLGYQRRLFNYKLGWDNNSVDWNPVVNLELVTDDNSMS